MLQAIGPYNSGDAAGGAGVATANATGTDMITGRVVGFYIRFNDSPPAGTTDTTIQATGGIMPTRTLFTITNGATDGFYAVRDALVNSSNAAITNSHGEHPLVRDKIKVTIAQANNGDSVDVWVVTEV